MKTSELKAYKTKVYGKESTIVKKSEIEGRALPNLLFEIGFQDHSNFYYCKGVHKILGEIKTMIKQKMYNSGETFGTTTTIMNDRILNTESAMRSVDNAVTFEELAEINKSISAF